MTVLCPGWTESNQNNSHVKVDEIYEELVVHQVGLYSTSI